MNGLLLNVIYAFTIASANPDIGKAQQTLDAFYQNYTVPSTCPLREDYPFSQDNKATYLAPEEQAKRRNEYSYLWPYPGTFSAVNVLLESTENKKYKKLLENKVLPGLEEYFDTRREPCTYSSYISGRPLSDRFYDDNVWLGIDSTDSYRMTGKQAHLEKAKLIWKLILSGKDDVFGGGVYWCEQKKEFKDICSNVPGVIFALRLFQATQDDTYLKEGKELYEWTKKNLENSKDHLYFDNIPLNKKIGHVKFAYNNGRMMQAAALLYQITKQKSYLEDAQSIAEACHKHFFTQFTSPDGQTFRLLKKGNIWFTAVTLRGFIKLYQIDHNKTYLTDFQRSLDYAWHHARDERSLFQTDRSDIDKNEKKWLLTQAAFIEMYGRLSGINLQ